MGSLDGTSRAAHGTGKGPDPPQVSGIAAWFHPQLLLKECRPVARLAPETSAPVSIAALIERLSTVTSGFLTCPRTAARCSISSPSSNCSHVTAGSFNRSSLYSDGMAASSVTSTDGGQARRLKVVVFPSSLRYFPLPSVPRFSMVPITIVLQPRESAFAGRLALSQPVDLELGKVDLLLQMRQELTHSVAFVDCCGQGGLELRSELLLLLRGNQLGGFDQRRKVILDHIQLCRRHGGRRNYGQGSHHATSGCAAMCASRP